MPRFLSSSLALGMLLMARNADAETPTAATASAASADAHANAKAIAAGPVVHVGELAPDFALPDTDGTVHRLSEHRGQTVVLEWFNPGCPFVKYAYGEGLLPALSARWTDKGVSWLAINSSAPGKQGHGADLNGRARERWQLDRPVLLDETGAVGQRFGARTTPQIFVIDPTGVLRYAGALDNAPLGVIDDDERIDFVDRALTQLAAGATVDPDHSKSYGCSVKYAD